MREERSSNMNIVSSINGFESYLEFAGNFIGQGKNWLNCSNFNCKINQLRHVKRRTGMCKPCASIVHAYGRTVADADCFVHKNDALIIILFLKGNAELFEPKLSIFLANI